MSIGGDLHKYLWTGSKSDGFTGFYGSTSQAAQGLGRKNDLGRTMVYSPVDLQSAATAKDKLTVADELARVSRVQVDAALRTGRADNIAKVADTARQVLDQVHAALHAERTPGAAIGSDEIDPKLAPYKTSVDAILETYSATAATLATLRGKLSEDRKPAFDQAMMGLDASATKVADLVKSKWQDAAASSGGFRPDPTKLVDIIV